MERRWLADRGFAVELTANRKRPGKVSAMAKAELLMCELQYRRIEAEAEPSERTVLHLALLRSGSPKGAAAYGAGELAWSTWKKAHRSELDAALGLIDKSINSKKVVRVARAQRYALGEQRYNGERYDALVDELGEPFIAGLVDRAAKVRQWERRRRLRDEQSIL